MSFSDRTLCSSTRGLSFLFAIFSIFPPGSSVGVDTVPVVPVVVGTFKFFGVFRCFFVGSFVFGFGLVLFERLYGQEGGFVLFVV